MLDEISLGNYTYQDIFDCLADGSILQINTLNAIQPTTTLTINSGIQIQSILDNGERANFKCPLDNTPLFIIK